LGLIAAGVRARIRSGWLQNGDREWPHGVRNGLKQALVKLVRNSKAVRQAASWIAGRAAYESLKQRFIHNGASSKFDEAVRSKIVSRFELIDRNVAIATTPSDGLFLAEMLLNMDAPGAIVECGCYAGGSSAKLSILARILERQLTIFDSFQGLPAVDDRFLRDHHCREGQDWVTDWTAGRYAAQLEKVRSNIQNYGEIAVCSFVSGWFSNTLKGNAVPNPIAFAFTDVDLVNSAKECLVSLWPRLSEHGIYVTHDAAYIKVLQEMYDPEWWRTLDCVPPILFGAGYGMSNESPHLAYMVKGDALSAEYLKTLTINK
jgi:O-methyltransferase